MTEHDFDIEEPTTDLDTSELDLGTVPVDPKDIDTSADNVVDTIQRKRMAILMSDAPIDKDQLALMNDLGKTAQTQQRINVENKAVESDAEIAKSLAAMVTSGISLKQDNGKQERDVTPPTIDSKELEGIEVSEQLVTTHQEEISLDEIMKAEDLKSDN